MLWLDLVPPTDTNSGSPTTSNLTHDNGQIDPDDFYVARVGWWPDNSIMVQIQNRRQTVMQLLRVDPRTGQREVVLCPILTYHIFNHI